MESRSGETPAPFNLFGLPDEIQLIIFNLADLPSLGRLLCTSNYFSNFFDDRFWDNKQNSDFTPTPYSGDNKNQYLAESLYQRAMFFTNADEKQISASHLRRFLQQAPQQWSHYYRGLTFYRGLGVKKDHSLGFKTLIDALDLQDYRAAIMIARILVQKKIDKPASFQKLIIQLDHDRQQLMLNLVLNTHQKQIYPVTKLLGCLHALGIAAEKNFRHAEKYYLDTSTDFANDIAELARLMFDSLSAELSLEQKAEQTVAYLKTFIDKAPKKPLESVINYWSGYLEITRGDYDAAIRWLNQTPDFPYAERLLAHALNETNLPELATLYLLDLCPNDDEICGELFDMQMKYSTVCDAVTQTIELTNCRMITLAIRVSAFYRQNMELDTLARDPNTVWWLQLAAQAGCKESLVALESVKAQAYPYVCYALAIIYKFGILHSKVASNHDKTEYYFHLAKNVDLEEYLNIGVEQTFACTDVADLLKSKLDLKIKYRM